MTRALTEADEQRIFDAQGLEIRAKYGKEAEGTANYGWGVSEYDVATKVYLRGGHKVLSSRIGSNGEVAHEWSDY